MKWNKALGYGVLGAAAMSIVMGLARSMGMHVQLELMLGTMLGIAPEGSNAFVVGLVMHLMMGAAFGATYAWLFERVIHHGGVAAGALVGLPHAIVAGLFMAMIPAVHPFIPESMPAPGAFMSNLGAMGVMAELMLHVMFGAIVGAGYGHVQAERSWRGAAHA